MWNRLESNLTLPKILKLNSLLLKISGTTSELQKKIVASNLKQLKTEYVNQISIKIHESYLTF